MSIHGSPVIQFPAHELADLKARLAAGHTISSAHPQGKHKAGDILMSGLGMLRVMGVKPVAPHELTAHSGATKAHVAGGQADMLELKKLGTITMLKFAATTILADKTKVAFDPSMFQNFPVSELLQADPGIDVQPNLPYGHPVNPMAHHLATETVRANANIPLVLSPGAREDAMGHNMEQILQSHGYPTGSGQTQFSPAAEDQSHGMKYQIRDMTGYDDPTNHRATNDRYDVDRRAMDSLLMRQGVHFGHR